MYSKSLILAALASLVAADLAGDASAVVETASILSSLVDGWSSGDGLSGALAIQETYGPLSEAVAALEGSVGSVTEADITSDNVNALATLSTTVAGLLDALTSKASDFESVGASSIVQGDIQELSGPSGNIINTIYSIGSADCDAISSLAGPVGSLSAAFGSAAQAYSADAPTFPELTCAGGDDSGESSGGDDASSAAPTGEESSAPAEDTTVAEASSAEATGVASANAAAAAGVGAVVAAGVAALLL